MKLREVIAGADCPGYTTDVEGRIVDLNRSAELLLGYKKRDVLGKKCHELLNGEDGAGNRFCPRDCETRFMAPCLDPVAPFSLAITNASGARIDVTIHIVTFTESGGDSVSIAHLIEPRVGIGGRTSQPSTTPPDSALPRMEPDMAPELSPGARLFRLTQREVEVLRLMAQGKNCAEISRLLTIAVATTRNHIRNILRKLDVHSQAEAISFTYRNNLL